MRRAAALIAFAVGLAVAGACNTFGAGPDGDDVAPENDAGVLEGSTLEGSVLLSDAGPGAASVSDAAVDAANVDAGAFGDIARNDYSIFDDFERETPTTGSPFSWKLSGVVAKAECPNGKECSTSRALSLWVTKTQANPLMVTDLDKGTKFLRYDFAMRTDAHGLSLPHSQLASVEINNERYIYLEVRNGMLRIGDQFKPNGEYDSQEIDLAPHLDNEWARFRFFVDFENRLAGVARNKVVLGVKHLRPQVTDAPFEPKKMRFGASYWDGQNEFDIFVDDVGKLDGTKPLKQ